MKFKKTAALGLAGLLSATIVIADGHVDPAIAGAIEARQAHMKLYAFNLGTLGGMAQEKIPYDADMASTAAANLVALSEVNQTAYWPMGSDSDSVEESRALPVIWTDFEGSMAAGQKFTMAAAAMNEAAGVDLASLQGAMGDLGASCGGCHRAYRVRN